MAGAYHHAQATFSTAQRSHSNTNALRLHFVVRPAEPVHQCTHVLRVHGWATPHTQPCGGITVGSDVVSNAFGLEQSLECAAEQELSEASWQAGPQAHGRHTYVNCSGDKSTVRHTEVLEVMAFDCASMLKPGWDFTNCCTAFKLRSQRRCNSSTPPTRSTQVRASI